MRFMPLRLGAAAFPDIIIGVSISIEKRIGGGGRGAVADPVETSPRARTQRGFMAGKRSVVSESWIRTPVKHP